MLTPLSASCWAGANLKHETASPAVVVVPESRLAGITLFLSPCECRDVISRSISMDSRSIDRNAKLAISEELTDGASLVVKRVEPTMEKVRGANNETRWLPVRFDIQYMSARIPFRGCRYDPCPFARDSPHKCPLPVVMGSRHREDVTTCPR